MEKLELIQLLVVLAPSVRLIICPPFELHQSFITPQLTSDGKPYGPIKYKELLKEAYLIVKHTGATYDDVMSMSPTERKYVLSFLIEEAERNKKSI